MFTVLVLVCVPVKPDAQALLSVELVEHGEHVPGLVTLVVGTAMPVAQLYVVVVTFDPTVGYSPEAHVGSEFAVVELGHAVHALKSHADVETDGAPVAPLGQVVVVVLVLLPPL